MMDPKQDTKDVNPTPLERPKWSWGRIVTIAGLLVLGITPWANAQLPPPNLPAFCPPLNAFAGPTMFDLFWGTSPLRFPYQ